MICPHCAEHAATVVAAPSDATAQGPRPAEPTHEEIERAITDHAVAWRQENRTMAAVAAEYLETAFETLSELLRRERAAREQAEREVERLRAGKMTAEARHLDAESSARAERERAKALLTVLRLLHDACPAPCMIHGEDIETVEQHKESVEGYRRALELARLVRHGCSDECLARALSAHEQSKGTR